MADFSLKQRQLQSQVQVMSQKQIQALNLLALNSQDLSEEIYKIVQENPALVIVHDKSNWDGTKVAQASASGELASEDFQAALEAKADTRESLQEHLMSQLNMINLSETQRSVCEKLIYNLDSKGFHILSPISLVDKRNRLHTPGLLENCINIIHQLEPAGVCVTNTEESLYVQALQRDKPPLMALFLLDGKLNFLDPPKADKILAKVKNYFNNQKKLFAVKDDDRYANLELSVSSVQEALDFIRTLDPFPARNFSIKETHFVSPDIYVERIKNEDDTSIEDNIIRANGFSWKVRTSKDSLPQIALNPDFIQLASKNEIQSAKEFLKTIEFRQSTLLKACIEIVKKQNEFFAKGPGNLLPLKLQDIADILKVHETTISRMANSKFLQCEWGLFDIKYFFTSAASSKSPNVSQDKAMSVLKKILLSSEGKNLSDLKLSKELEKYGIKIARRTVAKYRSKLSIESSYNR